MSWYRSLQTHRLGVALVGAALITGCTPSTPEPPGDLAVTITAEPDSGLAPLTVRLSSSVIGGTGRYVTYAWTLDDGATSDEEDVVHTFEQAGEFNVTLEVTDSQGGQGTGQVTIVVGDDNSPVASASASPARGIAPLTVSFTGTGLGGDAPLAYSWSFGDGSEEVTSQNPTHTFEQPGNYTATLIVTDNDGDQDEATVLVEVVDNTVPIVEITAAPTSGIAPLTVSFNAVVLGGDAPLSFAWDFGDGGTSVIQSPSHEFTEGGVYTVSVIVTDASGDESADEIVITVGDDNTPTVTAEASPDSGLAPLAVTLRAVVSGGNEPFSFQWDFGDGSPSGAVQNPAHTYTIAGNYTATVIVTDADGDTASNTVSIEVGGDDTPSATANATPVSGIAPLVVSFTGSGVGGNAPLAYSWNFGDGSPVVATQNPTHTYTVAGVYNAILIVTDADGDTDSDTVTIEVASNEVPVVEASATPRNGIEPLTVSFGASVAGGDAPLTYDWNFGDGSAHSSATSPSHTYTQGSWTATVTVTDSNGDADSDTVTIEVGGDDVPSISATALPTSGRAPLPVSFSSIVTGGNAPFTFNWNFGDGDSATTQNASHTFDVASTYTVTVTVQDADGDVANDTVEVAVANDRLPVASASASPIEGVSPLLVAFFGTATGGDAPLTYEWTFGDGSPASTTQNPTHTYTTGGTYTATLVVTDADDDTDSDTVTIEVSDDGTPVAFVNATPNNGLIPLEVTLTCGASGGNPPLSYLWTFGDGSPTDEAPTTSHRYESAGTFTATCTVTDSDGDSDSDAIDIHVGDTAVPAVNASASPMAGRFPLEVDFTAEVLGGTAPFTFRWDFNDGSPAGTTQNPTHTFAASGVYNVTIQVTDFDGDIATDTLDISVLETESDLEITDFHVDVTDVITYSVTVRNNGPDATQNFFIDLFYDEVAVPEGTLLGDRYAYVTETVASGAEVTRTFERNRAPIAEQAWAVVDIGESIPDTDRTNNVWGPLDVTVTIIVINEVYYDAPSGDAGTAFVELYGTPGLDLSGWVIAPVNGSNGLDYSPFTLPAGTVMPDDALLVVAAADTVANYDLAGLTDLQNGPDSVQLRDDTGTLIDAVAYGTFSGTEFPAGEGTPAVDVLAGYTLGRGPDQPDTNDNATDFLVYRPTPGELNHPVNDLCAEAFELDLNAFHVGTTVGYVSDGATSITGGCGATEHGLGPDAIFVFTLAAPATVHLDTNGSDFDTVLHVRSDCADVLTELGCDDDSGDGLDSLLEVDLAAGTYYVFVDGYFESSQGTYVLNHWTL